MGRKRKPTVKIDFEANSEFEPSNDGLPPFVSFVDACFDKDIGSTNAYPIRVFFTAPSEQEYQEIEQLYHDSKKSLRVVGSKVNWGTYMGRTSKPILQYITDAGFNEKFAKDVCRILIKILDKVNLRETTISNKISAVKFLIDFLSSKKINKKTFFLESITIEHWIEFAEVIGMASKGGYKKFQIARSVFENHKPCRLAGNLSKVRLVKQDDYREMKEHTSEFVDKSYSEGELYQLLALFLAFIKTHTECREHYEQISEDDMPNDWISADKAESMYNSTKEDKKKLGNYFEELLRDEKNDSVMIDHFLLYKKLSSMKLLEDIYYYANYRTKKTERLLAKFLDRARNKYNIKKGAPKYFLDMFINDGKDSFRHQHGFCLANLLMMYAGLNKSLVLTIPSRTDDGKSILERGQYMYKSKDGKERECELYGWKTRTKQNLEKQFIQIPKNSPIYKLLKNYERYVKKDVDGPFFEFTNAFKANWPRAGLGRKDDKKVDYYFPFYNEKGELYTEIECTRFRKVFAAASLLKKIATISNPHELIDEFKKSLKHKNFDTSFSHYLMGTNFGRGIIDSAIVAVTSSKIEEGISFRGKVELRKNGANERERVFLCECEDPFNPSHDVAIADKCRHYDLCLGCERCVITREHLPYICARILQYEEARIYDSRSWPMTYEDRWMIAHDALTNYERKDKKNGKRIVQEAWDKANNGEAFMPHIIDRGIYNG